jgi:cytochrome b
MRESFQKTPYFVWDKGVRWFHWINFLCVLCLVAIGTVILFAKELQVGSDGKVLLKTWHVYIGYVFAVNLLFRLLWAFIGGHYSRWRAFLPLGKGFVKSSIAYLRGFVAGDHKQYMGHNPLARLMITFMFLLLLIQATSGLILAGTDLYMPPFGAYFAQWVTNGNQEMLAQLKPGSLEFVDPEAYSEMRLFRTLFISTHVYVFYTLLVAILLHIAAVVVTEVRSRSGIISAMFTGEKWVGDSDDKDIQNVDRNDS